MGILWHISRLGEKMRKQECVIKVPGLNEKFRFKVPDHMSIAEVISLLAVLIKEEYPEVWNCIRPEQEKKQTEPNVLRNWKYQSKKNGF